MIHRALNQIDSFCLVIVAFTVLLIATHKTKHAPRVSIQAIEATEPANDSTATVPDPMDNDNPGTRYQDALARVEQADSDNLRARAAGVPANELNWKPVDPRPLYRR
jgi:hypothetical protein